MTTSIPQFSNDSPPTPALKGVGDRTETTERVPTTDQEDSLGAETEPQPGTTGDQPPDATEKGDSVETTADRIKRLPSAVGLTLLGVGIIGVILPGPIGTPFLIAAGLALAPKTFGRLEVTLQRRWPKLHQHGMGFLVRFLDDFEKRYPPDE